MKRHQKVFVFAKNNRFGEACSYYNEPYKTAVAVKEIINLKYENDKSFPQQKTEDYLKKV